MKNRAKDVRHPLVLGVALLASLSVSLFAASSAAAAISGKFTVWGMSASFGPPTPLVQWDTSGTVLRSFTGAEPGGYCVAPTPVPDCNGRGVAILDKKHLWVSVLSDF